MRLLFLFFFCAILSAQDFNESIYLDSISEFSLSELDDLTVDLEYQKDTLRGLTTSKYLIYKSKEKQDLEYRCRGYFSLYLFEKNQQKRNKIADSMIYSSERSKIKYLISDAYFLKGNSLYFLGKYASAMENLAKSYTFALEDRYFSNIRLIETRMASIKNILARYYEANVIYKNALSEYEESDFNELDDKKTYLDIVYNLTLSFYYLKQYDSTLYYGKKGEYLLEDYPSEFYAEHFKRSEALGLLGKGKLEKSISLFKESVNHLSKHDLSCSYYYIGEAYRQNNELDSCYYYYNLSDSILSADNVGIFPELRNLYKNSYQHYQNKDSLKAIHYLEKYFAIDSTFRTRDIAIGEKLHRLYDLPRLKAEQQKQNSRKNRYLGIITFLVLGLVITLVLVIREKKENKKQKKIVNNFIADESSSLIIKEVKPAKGSGDSKSYMNPESKEMILKLLDCFKVEKGYLDSRLTQASLAEKWKTTTNDISKVINGELGTSFPNYLKTLRIENAVVSLRTNPELLKYSINGLADEFGFNNPDSFSRAFKEITKVKPSIYIGELKKHLKITDNL